MANLSYKHHADKFESDSLPSVDNGGGDVAPNSEKWRKIKWINRQD